MNIIVYGSLMVAIWWFFHEMVTDWRSERRKRSTQEQAIKWRDEVE